MSRHFFLLQFVDQRDSDITLTTTDDDLADQMINGDGAGWTPWMETTARAASGRYEVVPGPLTRANLRHVAFMAHMVGPEAKA